MPWTVQIEDENGCVQSGLHPIIEFSLIFSIPDFQLLHANTKSSLLKYLDPWGDTVFNRLQLTDLRDEWLALNPSKSEIENWESVTQMIDICTTNPHFYLRFLGD